MNAAEPAFTISPWAFPALFGTGLVAGFVDSIAGGGGLITVPVLLNLGIPPHLAFGTNKLQASFGSGSAAWHFAQSGIVSLRECFLGIVFTVIGAAAGTWVVLQCNPDFLKQFIPIILLAIAAYMIFKPKLGEKDLHPRMAAAPFYVGFGLALGFYDGFLGPGTGSFWAMAFMLALGFNLTKATGYTKVMNFASNIASLAYFLIAGRILYGAGLTMGIGQLLGARVGSRMVVTRGTRFIRPIFLTMVLALTLKLLYDAFRKH
jgi:uncharacterized membrane protein YfcA